MEANRALAIKVIIVLVHFHGWLVFFTSFQAAWLWKGALSACCYFASFLSLIAFEWIFNYYKSIEIWLLNYLVIEGPAPFSITNISFFKTLHEYAFQFNFGPIAWVSEYVGTPMFLCSNCLLRTPVNITLEQSKDQKD